MDLLILVDSILMYLLIKRKLDNYFGSRLTYISCFKDFNRKVRSGVVNKKNQFIFLFQKVTKVQSKNAEKTTKFRIGSQESI